MNPNPVIEKAVADRLRFMEEAFGKRPDQQDREVYVRQRLEEALSEARGLGVVAARGMVAAEEKRAAAEESANQGNWCKTLDRSGDYRAHAEALAIAVMALEFEATKASD